MNLQVVLLFVCISTVYSSMCIEGASFSNGGSTGQPRNCNSQFCARMTSGVTTQTGCGETYGCSTQGCKPFSGGELCCELSSGPGHAPGGYGQNPDVYAQDPYGHGGGGPGPHRPYRRAASSTFSTLAIVIALMGLI